MSLKRKLMPTFANALLGRRLRDAHRTSREWRRRVSRRPHVVEFFYRADDPYSTLLAQALPGFLQRYRVELRCLIPTRPPESATPRPDLWHPWARRDAASLAGPYSLEFPADAIEPSEAVVDAAHGALQRATGAGEFLAIAAQLSNPLWTGEVVAGPKPDDAAMVSARRRLEGLGHYAPGMLLYEGEWYWGIDRLHMLEERLEGLGLGRGRTLAWSAPTAVPTGPIDFTFSFRSPYSYIAAERLLGWAEAEGREVNLRPVLPMVMRGLPVPKPKKMYIARDAARLAAEAGIPFGKVCDPVGVGVERAVAVLSVAGERAADFVRSAYRGAWSEGIDLETDAGLRSVCERAGVSWVDAQSGLADGSWRDASEVHREALFALGLWGVPSFHCAGWSAWGQDRLWQLGVPKVAG